MKKFFKTTVNQSAENLETIYVSAGKVGYQVEIKPKDLAKVIKYEFADVVCE
jgi:Cys-tRNA(Pro)/Cys-tRNA(Cys) deacylase